MARPYTPGSAPKLPQIAAPSSQMTTKEKELFSGVGAGASTVEEACFRKGHNQAEADMMAAMEEAVKDAEVAHRQAQDAAKTRKKLEEELRDIEKKTLDVQARIHKAELGIQNIDAEHIPDTDAHDISEEEKLRREQGREQAKQQAKLAAEKEAEEQAFLSAMRAAKLEIVVATEMSENEKFRNKLSTLEDADHRRQVAAAARESTLGTLEARLRGVRAENARLRAAQSAGKAMSARPVTPPNSFALLTEITGLSAASGRLQGPVGLAAKALNNGQKLDRFSSNGPGGMCDNCGTRPSKRKFGCGKHYSCDDFFHCRTQVRRMVMPVHSFTRRFVTSHA